ncbi:MAG: hypothetical protein OQL19_15305 [Gammaproteobacteria bacterium]|nr:hypothetical protein [Gammaproteobacteria bacterium]
MTTEIKASNLIKQYINIVNFILAKQKNISILQGLILLLENLFPMKDINVNVVDENDHLIANFSTRFAEGQFSPIRQEIANPDAQFKVKLSYLQEFIDNAGYYIEHPVKLNLDWLTGCVEKNN